MKLGKLMRNKERSSAKSLIEKFNMKNNEWSISKEVIFEVEDKTFAVFVWHIRIKVMMRVSEEIHGLLRDIARLRRKLLKRCEKPVNHSHENELFDLIFLSFFQ